MAGFNRTARAAGAAAENDARWYIDRTFHQAQNWRVIHDLVLLDHRSDAICQIDHLVFGRMGCFLVLETKSAVNGMSIHAESGAWSVWHGGRWLPMKSPIAQNIRHIEVLRDFMEKNEIMPKRLFVSIPPAFENWIMVQPGARLPTEFEGARIVQRDQFPQVFEAFLEKMSLANLLKAMTTAELDSIAERLTRESQKNKLARGLPLDGGQREFQVEIPKENEPSAAPGGRRATSAAASKRGSPSRLENATVQPVESAPNTKVIPCAKCGAALTPKEVSYCRFNFAKMGRRYLCRKCQ